MDIKEKIFINKQELEKYGPINIVAFVIVSLMVL